MHDIRHDYSFAKRFFFFDFIFNSSFVFEFASVACLVEKLMF